MIKIIDVHVHCTFEDERMLGVGVKESGVDYSKKGLDFEMKKNGVIHIVSVQNYAKQEDGTLLQEFNPPLSFTPMDGDFSYLVAINPLTKPELDSYEELIKTGKIKGFKIYLGYYHFYPYDKVYTPFYKLAEKYNLVVMFHTGDNYSKVAKLKYAHPLNIDEVAVDYPGVKFIIAHLGEPWSQDAAEVLFKNSNIYADLSGLVTGDLKKIEHISIRRIREALEYCGYDRIMYGSDWPLAPMDKYIKLIKKIVPRKEWEKVFYSNAKRLFQLNHL